MKYKFALVRTENGLSEVVDFYTRESNAFNAMIAREMREPIDSTATFAIYNRESGLQVA